jgi:hypothetical protein
MPLVVTTVNLDFDEKNEFVRKFGKSELSHFLRKAIHEKLEEKNREALINLSPIAHVETSIIISPTKTDKSLDKWIEYARAETRWEPLVEINPKTKLLSALVDGKVRGMRPRRI